jgi:hypothetical protein
MQPVVQEWERRKRRIPHHLQDIRTTLRNLGPEENKVLNSYMQSAPEFLRTVAGRVYLYDKDQTDGSLDRGVEGVAG